MAAAPSDAGRAPGPTATLTVVGDEFGGSQVSRSRTLAPLQAVRLWARLVGSADATVVRVDAGVVGDGISAVLFVDRHLPGLYAAVEDANAAIGMDVHLRLRALPAGPLPAGWETVWERGAAP